MYPFKDCNLKCLNDFFASLCIINIISIKEQLSSFILCFRVIASSGKIVKKEKTEVINAFVAEKKHQLEKK